MNKTVSSNIEHTHTQLTLRGVACTTITGYSVTTGTVMHTIVWLMILLKLVRYAGLSQNRKARPLGTGCQEKSTIKLNLGMLFIFINKGGHMYKVRITSLNYTFIECIYCCTLQQAYEIKLRVLAMNLSAGIFNVL